MRAERCCLVRFSCLSRARPFVRVCDSSLIGSELRPPTPTSERPRARAARPRATGGARDGNATALGTGLERSLALARPVRRGFGVSLVELMDFYISCICCLLDLA